MKGKAVGQIVIRFAEEKEDRTKPKRFYSEPTRWLQELYPIDEFIARDLGIAVDKVHFEMGTPKNAVYEVVATDAKNAVLLQQAFAPRVRDMAYLKAHPGMGIGEGHDRMAPDRAGREARLRRDRRLRPGKDLGILPGPGPGPPPRPTS